MYNVLMAEVKEGGVPVLRVVKVFLLIQLRCGSDSKEEVRICEVHGGDGPSIHG